MAKIQLYDEPIDAEIVESPSLTLAIVLREFIPPALRKDEGLIEAIQEALFNEDEDALLAVVRAAGIDEADENEENELGIVGNLGLGAAVLGIVGGLLFLLSGVPINAVSSPMPSPSEVPSCR